MISNTHEDGQIVVSKEITPISPPKNLYGSNKYTLAESSLSRKSKLSKIEEHMKSSVHPNNVKGKGVVVENISSVNEKEAIVLDDNNELSHIEEINICDTCGDLGREKLLVVCSDCEIGAEHTYCMLVKLEERPDKWYCYDCTEDGDGMRKGEETSSMKRKGESFIDFFKMEERTSSQDQLDLLNTQSFCKTVGVDLNIDPNLDLNAYPNIDLSVESSSRKRKAESFIDFLEMSEKKSPQRQPDLLNTQSYCKIVGLDLNIDPILDLNADPNIDLNVDPNINLNVDPSIDMNMGPNLSLS